MLTESQQAFVTNNYPLAMRVADRHAGRWKTRRDELYDAAIDGLTRAAVKQEEFESVSDGFLVYFIERAITDKIREVRAKKRNFGERPATLTSEPSITTRLPDESPTFDQLIAQFSPDKQKLLQCRFVHNMSWDDTAKHLKRNQRTLQHQERKALDKLRYNLI